MSQEFIERMFADRDSKQHLLSRKRQQELLRQSKVSALASTIWREIESVLLGPIESFNERAEKPLIIRRQIYCLHLVDADIHGGFSVKFDPACGVISYGSLFSLHETRNLIVNIDEEFRYSIHRATLDQCEIKIENVPEVVLGEFLKSLLKPL